MQQFEEEEINQDESGDNNEESVVEEGVEEIEPTKSMADKPKIRRYPSNRGMILTIFAAVVLVLIGGLASYYYYTFQSEGRQSSQEVKATWEEVVDKSEALLRASDRLDKYEDLALEGDSGILTIITDANRTVRDALFDLRNQTGLDVQMSTVISKLSGFLEDYGAWLGEFRTIAERAADADSEAVLDEFKQLAAAAESSYDELLQVNEGALRANLPRAIFDIPERLTTLLKSKLESDEEKAETDKSNQRAAETVVSKFVQAWQNKDAEAMAGYMTSGARNEFNPGIVEDSVEVIGFAITSTELTEDKTGARVAGNLKKRTPDGIEVSEAWRFNLVVVDGAWLIDAWDPI